MTVWFWSRAVRVLGSKNVTRWHHPENVLLHGAAGPCCGGCYHTQWHDYPMLLHRQHRRARRTGGQDLPSCRWAQLYGTVPDVAERADVAGTARRMRILGPTARASQAIHPHAPY